MQKNKILVAALVLAAPAAAHAQAAALVGSLANFDALNNTGQEAHGFEIEVEGIASQDIYRIFGNWGGTNVIRYGAGSAIDIPGGVIVRWASSVFAGWSGACSGLDPICVATVNDAVTVNATFLAVYTLSIGRSGSGTVVGTPAGNDRALSCGGDCSAKFTQGTTVTLTATPAPGQSFTGWSKDCAGSSPTTTVTIGKNTSCQASFK
jgi:uncharacterized repeat protein (TIGR02543 family)